MSVRPYECRVFASVASIRLFVVSVPTTHPSVCPSVASVNMSVRSSRCVRSCPSVESGSGTVLLSRLSIRPVRPPRLSVIRVRLSRLSFAKVLPSHQSIRSSISCFFLLSHPTIRSICSSVAAVSRIRPSVASVRSRTSSRPIVSICVHRVSSAMFGWD